MMNGRAALAGLLALAPVLGACDEGVLNPPEADDELFVRYVAIGNSITAGFQSAGINEDTQQESYAVLLAEQMGTDFAIPALSSPGCPAPLTDLLTGERVGDAGPEDCALRRSPVPEVLNNVAVPQATPLDVFDNLDPASQPNPLTLFILGGRTQAEAARAVDPTFATVWVGNNNALGVATTGAVNDETLTPLDTFEDRYATMLDELGADMEGVLVGVAHPIFVPFLSFAAVYWQLHEAGQLPDNFQVHESCSPDPQDGGIGISYVPFSYGFQELLLPALEDEELEVELNCAEDEQVLRPNELNEVTDRVNAYNDFVEAEAEARGWAFVNPNLVLQQMDQLGLIPPFPFEQPDQPFGPVFSLDGIHPNANFHGIAAEVLVESINEHYETELEPPDPPGAQSAGQLGGDAQVPRALQLLRPTHPPGVTRSEAAGVDTGDGGR